MNATAALSPKSRAGAETYFPIILFLVFLVAMAISFSISGMLTAASIQPT